jgi:predicted ABC-type ATPase
LPVLTVIAGPNGAGKSTHSKELLADFGIEAFDFDKEFYAIWSEFNLDPFIEQGVFERAQKLYTDRRTVALQNKQNFAFETNYHTNEIFSVVELFRSRRYHLELIFICLESSEIAVERVKDRVAKGGHSVDETTIKKRFGDGLDLLDTSFPQFDLVSIYLSKQNNIEGVAILEPPRNKAISVSRIPASLISHLPKLAKFVEQNR